MKEMKKDFSKCVEELSGALEKLDVAHKETVRVSSAAGVGQECCQGKETQRRRRNFRYARAFKDKITGKATFYFDEEWYRRRHSFPD